MAGPPLKDQLNSTWPTHPYKASPPLEDQPNTTGMAGPSLALYYAADPAFSEARRQGFSLSTRVSSSPLHQLMVQPIECSESKCNSNSVKLNSWAFPSYHVAHDMLHVINARCGARDLQTVALGRTCWRQFAAQWGDCKQSWFASFNAIIIIILSSSSSSLLLLSSSSSSLLLLLHGRPITIIIIIIIIITWPTYHYMVDPSLQDRPICTRPTHHCMVEWPLHCRALTKRPKRVHIHPLHGPVKGQHLAIHQTRGRNSVYHWRHADVGGSLLEVEQLVQPGVSSGSDDIGKEDHLGSARLVAGHGLAGRSAQGQLKRVLSQGIK